MTVRLEELLTTRAQIEPSESSELAKVKQTRVLTNLLNNGDLSRLSTSGKQYNGDDSGVDWKKVFSIFFGKLEGQRAHANYCRETLTETYFAKIEKQLIQHKEFFFHKRDLIPPLTRVYLEDNFFP